MTPDLPKDVVMQSWRGFGSLAAGANTSFGFQAGYSGTNTAPTLTCVAS